MPFIEDLHVVDSVIISQTVTVIYRNTKYVYLLLYGDKWPEKEKILKEFNLPQNSRLIHLASNEIMVHGKY
jgi:hypothetical protein